MPCGMLLLGREVGRQQEIGAQPTRASASWRVSRRVVRRRFSGSLIPASVRALPQRVADRIDLLRSRSIDVTACRTVCLALGPYRNLTTLTAAVLFLHPHCQVLNHAGDRVFGRSEVDPFGSSGFDPEWLRRFTQFAMLIATKGKRGAHGGAIIHSHAFDDEHRLNELVRAVGADVRKPHARCLFWKESLKTANVMRARRIDLRRIFAQDDDRLRFLLPIRHPLDCAVSNVRTGHATLFEHGRRPSNVHDVIDAVLREIAWFGELQQQFPERCFHYFQHEISREMLTRLARFLRLEPMPRWLDAAVIAMEVGEGYQHDAALRKEYRGKVEARFAKLPQLREGLLRFATTPGGRG